MISNEKTFANFANNMIAKIKVEIYRSIFEQKNKDEIIDKFKGYCIDKISLIKENISIKDKVCSLDVFLPFSGDKTILFLQPSTHIMSLVPFSIFDNNIIIQMSIKGQFKNNSVKIKEQIDNDVNSIEKHINYLNIDIEKFNCNLPHIIEECIKEEEVKYLNHKKMISEIGIPIMN